MSNVVIQGNASGTGDFTIAAPNSDTDRTLTLPDEAGEVIVTDGTTLVVDNTNDRVGIGTSSPQAKLHVSNNQGGAFGRILLDANVSSGYETSLNVTDTGFEVTSKSNSRPIIFNTGTTPAERMSIDGSGIVTKPNQPLFSGYQSGSNTGATGGSTDYLIICNGSYVNNGSHYNTSTGVFTCPVDGIYRVHAYAMSITASANGVFYATKLRLYVNGAGAGNYAYNYGDGYRHVSGNWALTCSANDTLGVMSNDSLGGYNWIIIELVG